MLYRFMTNIATPRFNINLRIRDFDRYTSVGLDQYENLAIVDPSDPGLPGLTCYLLKQGLDADCFAVEAGLSVGNNGQRQPDPQKIPDFWTTDPLPVVTQAFKDLIEEIDPGIHQFFEFNLFVHEKDEQIDHTKFYTFICGRLLDIVPDTELPDAKSYSVQSLGFPEAPKIKTIQERPDIQKYIADLPIWSFRTDGRDVYFVSASLLRKARARGLKGFTDFNSRSRGNVGHVKYSS